MEIAEAVSWVDIAALCVGVVSLVLAWLAASFFSQRSELRSLVQSTQSQLDLLRAVFLSAEGKVEEEAFSKSQEMLHRLTRIKHEVAVIQRLSNNRVSFSEMVNGLRKKITSDRLMSSLRRQDERVFVADVLNSIEDIHRGLDSEFWDMHNGRNLTVSVFWHAVSLFKRHR